MITVLHFNAMLIDEQAKITIKGNFIDDRIAGKLTVQLYRLDHFYVEVFYDAEKNEIIRYEGFMDTNRLAPYIRLN